MGDGYVWNLVLAGKIVSLNLGSFTSASETCCCCYCWCLPVIYAFGKLRQEDYYQFEASLGYIASIFVT